VERGEEKRLVLHPLSKFLERGMGGEACVLEMELVTVVRLAFWRWS